MKCRCILYLVLIAIVGSFSPVFAREEPIEPIEPVIPTPTAVAPPPPVVEVHLPVITNLNLPQIPSNSTILPTDTLLGNGAALPPDAVTPTDTNKIAFSDIPVYDESGSTTDVLALVSPLSTAPSPVDPVSTPVPNPSPPPAPVTPAVATVTPANSAVDGAKTVIAYAILAKLNFGIVNQIFGPDGIDRQDGRDLENEIEELVKNKKMDDPEFLINNFDKICSWGKLIPYNQKTRVNSLMHGTTPFGRDAVDKVNWDLVVKYLRGETPPEKSLGELLDSSSPR